MNRTGFIEAGMSMMPGQGHQLVFEDDLYLDDNFDAEPESESDDDYVYEGIPTKLNFAVNAFSLSGITRLRVNLKEYTYGPGQLIIIPQGAIIDYSSHTPDTRFALMAFSGYNFPMLQNSDISVSYQQEIVNETVIISLSPSALQGIKDTYLLLRRIVSDDTIIAKHSVLSGYIYAMGQWALSELAVQRSRNKSERHSRNEDVFQNFLGHIQQHYKIDRSVAYYADLAHLSSKYFGQIIQKVSGRPPADWISDMVILDAKAMLLSGDHSIQQISDALNFANSSFFAKYFKEHVGCPPGQFSHDFQPKK